MPFFFTGLKLGHANLDYTTESTFKGRTKIKNKSNDFYIGGITEGFETIICFIMMILFYDYINYIAYIFGTLCWITFTTRVIFIKKLLKS